VQNGKISLAFRYFALLHWANGNYATVKMTSDVANAGSFFNIDHMPSSRRHFLELLRSVFITNCEFQIKCDQISTISTGSEGKSCRFAQVCEHWAVHGGRVPHDVHFHTHRLPATRVLPFDLMCVMMVIGSTCRSLI
jgi:hypothetical protein